MKVYGLLWIGVCGMAGFLWAGRAAGKENQAASYEIVQYGKMHEVVGQQQHQGRVALSDVIKRSGFFGVAAVEGLQGEATIFDGNVTVTIVGAEGKPERAENPSGVKAALLIGAYVTSWKDQTIKQDVSADDFDKQVEALAASAGVNTEQPFPFVIEGEFVEVSLHVINGACPIRARMRKEVIPKDKKPYEGELSNVAGRLVGVFAKEAVGNITHPATSTHLHLLYQDPATGEMLTGHVEKVAIKRGAVLSVP